jgi:hypothetical protein
MKDHRPTQDPINNKNKLRSPEHIRRKQRERRLKLIISGVLLLVVFGLAAWGTHMDALTVSEINVVGTTAVSKTDVQALVSKVLSGDYGYLFARSNSFLFPRDEIESEIKAAFPRVKAVDVDLSNLTEVTVTVTERQPVALWCTSEAEYDSCYFMDENAYVFAHAPNLSGTSFIRYVGGSIDKKDPIGEYFITSARFHELTVFINNLPKVGLLPVAYVTSGSSATVRTAANRGTSAAAGTDIRLDQSTDLDALFQNLSTVLSDQDFITQVEAAHGVQYIDLRFGDRIYFRLNNESAAE